MVTLRQFARGSNSKRWRSLAASGLRTWTSRRDRRGSTCGSYYSSRRCRQRTPNWLCTYADRCQLSSACRYPLCFPAEGGTKFDNAHLSDIPCLLITFQQEQQILSQARQCLPPIVCAHLLLFSRHAKVIEDATKIIAAESPRIPAEQVCNGV